MDSRFSREPKIAAGETLAVAILYFAIVFAFAFAMGIARTLWAAPRLGSAAAVLLEIPILLAISWIVAQRLLRYKDVALPQRAMAGAIALTLTLLSEAAFASFVRGQSVSAWAAMVMTPLGLVGLAGQAIFGAMPMFIPPDPADSPLRT
jgi:hypothetical protein